MNSLYIYRDAPRTPHDMTEASKQKTVVVGAGPVGALAALYAAQRGHDVEVYELRNGTCGFMIPVVLYDEVLSPRFQVGERTLSLDFQLKLSRVAGKPKHRNQ